MKKWISNGAEHSFHIQLINIYELLNKYLLVTRVVNPQLNRMDNMELDDDFEVMRQQLLLSKFVLVIQVLHLSCISPRVA